MTVLQLQMLLHYYAVAKPYALRDPDHANSQAVFEQRNELCHLGMLERADFPIGWKVTDKGKCFIDYIRNLPLPVPTCWEMPKEN